MSQREPSFRPDFAAEIDTPLDKFAEILAKEGVPAGLAGQIQRAVANAAQEGILDGICGDELGLRAGREIIRRILAYIGDGTNAGLRAWALDYAAGTNVFGGCSEISISIRWGCTKANVSYLVRTFKRELGLKGRAGKSEHAIHKYRERAIRSHRAGLITRQPADFAGRRTYESICQI